MSPQTLEAARSRISSVQRELAKELDALRSMTQFPDDLPASLRSKLETWEQIAISLNDFGIAAFFRVLQQTSSSGERTKSESVVHIRGLEARPWEIRKQDPLLPSVDIDEVVDCGRGQDQLTLKLDCRQPMNIRLETRSDEPDVVAPIPLLDNGEVTFDFSGIYRLPLAIAKQFRWIPSTACDIGGDLLSRNSVSPSRVKLGPIAVQRTQVTLGTYHALGGRIDLPRWLGQRLFEGDHSPTPLLSVKASARQHVQRLPVVGLSLVDVRSFLKQLPTAEDLRWTLLSPDEWEAIMCGPDRATYPWGGVWIPGACNVRSGADEVGLDSVESWPLDCSRWGIFDGGGNVEEWTTTGDDDWPIARGGSWYNDKQMARCGSRIDRSPDYTHPKLGFRLAITSLV